MEVRRTMHVFIISSLKIDFSSQKLFGFNLLSIKLFTALTPHWRHKKVEDTEQIKIELLFFRGA